MAIRFVTWVGGLTNKPTPDDADELYVRQEADNTSFATTWANIKTALGSVFAKVGAIGSSGLTIGTGKLLGRSTSGTGAVEEITLGTNLSFSGNTLNAAGGGGSPGGADTQVQLNDGGAFGGDAGLTYNKTAKALSVGGATVTTDNPVANLNQTWNAGAVAFTGFKLDVTDTASAAGSLLFNYQVGGASKAALRKDGRLTTGPGGTGTAVWAANSQYAEVITTGYGVMLSPNGTRTFAVINGGATLCINTGIFGFSPSITAAPRTAFAEESDGVMKIVNASSGSNYRDLKLRNLIGTGNLATGIAAKTANYTVTANDGTIEVDASGAALGITLFPCANNAGKIIIVKKIDSSANAVTVDANAGETIDGAATTVLAAQWNSVMLQVNATGTAWIKI